MSDALKLATDIVIKLKAEGYQAYFAGGWVRDHVMKHPSSDIDIATDARPQVILDLFPHTILVGLAFGVVIVVLGGHQFEISTFRQDITYTNGRKPDSIVFSSAKEDAYRRDFTINGMFYDPLEHVILDFVEGTRDIKEGIIRTIGDPHERFWEDRLRMVRAVRFAARFEFAIDYETQEAIKQNADTLYPPVAKERVWQELTKMSLSPNMDKAIIDLHHLGLLQVIFPSLAYIHLHDIKEKVRCYKYFPENTPASIYIAELFNDKPLAEILPVFEDLHASGKEKKLIILWHEALKLIKKNDKGVFNPVEWAHFFANNNAEICLNTALCSNSLAKSGEELEKYQQWAALNQQHIERIKKREPVVNAAKLMALGISPGKTMGALLCEAEKISINNNLHHSDQIINQLKETVQWKLLCNKSIETL